MKGLNNSGWFIQSQLSGRHFTYLTPFDRQRNCIEIPISNFNCNWMSPFGCLFDDDDDQKKPENGVVVRLLRLSLAAELNFNCDYVDEFYPLSTGFYLCLPPPPPNLSHATPPPSRLNQVMNLMKLLAQRSRRSIGELFSLLPSPYNGRCYSFIKTKKKNEISVIASTWTGGLGLIHNENANELIEG